MSLTMGGEEEERLKPAFEKRDLGARLIRRIQCPAGMYYQRSSKRGRGAPGDTLGQGEGGSGRGSSCYHKQASMRPSDSHTDSSGPSNSDYAPVTHYTREKAGDINMLPPAEYIRKEQYKLPR